MGASLQISSLCAIKKIKLDFFWFGVLRLSVRDLEHDLLLAGTQTHIHIGNILVEVSGNTFPSNRQQYTGEELKCEIGIV